MFLHAGDSSEPKCVGRVTCDARLGAQTAGTGEIGGAVRLRPDDFPFPAQEGGLPAAKPEPVALTPASALTQTPVPCSAPTDGPASSTTSPSEVQSEAVPAPAVDLSSEPLPAPEEDQTLAVGGDEGSFKRRNRGARGGKEKKREVQQQEDNGGMEAAETVEREPFHSRWFIR
ncbi:hypothetical protein RhiJN_21886 [Ceratobasidium sp. AG-Ba]|nr:hypothetical protein RhiJN_21886 [Ceratobasidium sp. AG-Ba]